MYTRNMTTAHAALFGASEAYLNTMEDELEGLRTFARASAEERN